MIRLLTQGDHFGDIGLLYKCKRTCSVISRNYNTLASLTYDRYKIIKCEYPIFRDELIKHTYLYNDPRKKFLK